MNHPFRDHFDLLRRFLLPRRSRRVIQPLPIDLTKPSLRFNTPPGPIPAMRAPTAGLEDKS